jgi:hypothetical protein
MLTPRFSLSQDDSLVFLVVECPFLRVILHSSLMSR